MRVEGPLFDDERARRENPAFFARVEGRSPFVTLKLAVSADGKITGSPGVRTAITGPEANAEVHWLRAGFAAILIGSETALVDDPLLTVRGSFQPRVLPIRVVLDGRGRLDPGARLLAEPSGPPVLVFTTEAVDPDWKRALLERRAEVVVVASGRTGRGVDPRAVLHELAAREMDSVLVEGGARVASAFLRAERVDRFWLFRSPEPLGEDGVGAFRGNDAVSRRWRKALRDGVPPEGWEPLVDDAHLGRDRRSIWTRSD